MASVRDSGVHEVELSRKRDEIDVFCTCDSLITGACASTSVSRSCRPDLKSFLLGIIGGGPIRLADHLVIDEPGRRRLDLNKE